MLSAINLLSTLRIKISKQNQETSSEKHFFLSLENRQILTLGYCHIILFDVIVCSYTYEILYNTEFQ